MTVPVEAVKYICTHNEKLSRCVWAVWGGCEATCTHTVMVTGTQEAMVMGWWTLACISVTTNTKMGRGGEEGACCLTQSSAPVCKYASKWTMMSSPSNGVLALCLN